MKRDILILELKHLLDRWQEIDYDIRSGREINYGEYREICERIHAVTLELEQIEAA